MGFRAGPPAAARAQDPSSPSYPGSPAPPRAGAQRAFPKNSTNSQMLATGRRAQDRGAVAAPRRSGHRRMPPVEFIAPRGLYVPPADPLAARHNDLKKDGLRGGLWQARLAAGVEEPAGLAQRGLAHPDEAAVHRLRAYGDHCARLLRRAPQFLQFLDGGGQVGVGEQHQSPEVSSTPCRTEYPLPRFPGFRSTRTSANRAAASAVLSPKPSSTRGKDAGCGSMNAPRFSSEPGPGGPRFEEFIRNDANCRDRFRSGIAESWPRNCS
jgi:hypothetical protein